MNYSPITSHNSGAIKILFIADANKGNKTFLLHSGSIDAIDIYHKAQQNLKIQNIIQNS